MATGNKHLECITLTAASSMSAASQQFCIVKQVSATECAPVSADTDVPLGVLQNSPGLGEPALVALAGFTQLRANADLSAGARVAGTTTARAIAVVAGTSTGFYAVGRVLSVDAAVNAGGLVSAVIDCRNPARNL
jgi:hypothetical protein